MSTDLVWLTASVLTGLLFIGMSIPLIRQKVPPNHWYGLRIPATHADEAVWYAANAKVGSELLVLGCLLIVVSLALSFTTLSFGVQVLLWVAVVEGGLIVVLVRSWRFANHMLQARQKQEKPSSSG